MTDASDDERRGERARARANHPSAGRIVVSSLTGEPMRWGAPARDGRGTTGAAPAAAEGNRQSLFPARTQDEDPDPGADESNDERLRRDVPPHWGTGT